MQRRLILAWILPVLLSLSLSSASTAQSANGLILDQQLDPNGRGYTVLRLWGSHYDMGYAQAELLGDYIVDGVNETRTFLGFYYDTVRAIMADAVWMPPGLEDELDGLVECLAVTHPAANIDALDLKVASTAGEWLYACRSHTCWGRYVADPIRTLSTRRLDFPTLMPTMNHHVLCARAPDDGSPRWVNLGWPGIPTVVTGVNEFGTVVSLHDYNCATDFAAGRMPRMVACRYALSFASDPDLSMHLSDTYGELQNYELMTGTFLNYYAPEGHGGVMVGYPYQSGPDFYYLRVPQPVWHHGEAMITTNAWTDGTYTPYDEDFGADAYYDDETPKTLESHWDLLAANSNSLHLLSVAYRGRADMTFWADGRLEGIGRTPRLEWEWHELFGYDLGDLNCDGTVNAFDIDPFVLALIDPVGFILVYPDCDPMLADINGDGEVNAFDIDPFVELMVGP